MARVRASRDQSYTTARHDRAHAPHNMTRTTIMNNTITHTQIDDIANAIRNEEPRVDIRVGSNERAYEFCNDTLGSFARVFATRDDNDVWKIVVVETIARIVNNNHHDNAIVATMRIVADDTFTQSFPRDAHVAHDDGDVA